ncbi:hypothetical protein NDU88_005111 [Pleurodeles waltl]|uniref:Uncharacterized protein n=1 Tax=Pleurodeles waltl TaxID=8319 RepID=A0AAV7RL73_PLEWA|nr:hypothetical protein NDU88_005111 [Pleurodeles waltl]
MWHCLLVAPVIQCLRIAVGGAGHPPRPHSAGPARHGSRSSWALARHGPLQTRAPARSSQGPPDPVGDNPGSGPRAPGAPASATQAHPRPTQLGRGRARAPRAQLTFLGAAPCAAVHTHGPHGSAAPQELRRGLRGAEQTPRQLHSSRGAHERGPRPPTRPTPPPQPISTRHRLLEPSNLRVRSRPVVGLTHASVPVF